MTEIDRRARAGLLLAIDEVRTAPGRDWGPGFTASDAFTDILTDLLARLDVGDPATVLRLNLLLKDI